MDVVIIIENYRLKRNPWLEVRRMEGSGLPSAENQTLTRTSASSSRHFWGSYARPPSSPEKKNTIGSCSALQTGQKEKLDDCAGRICTLLLSPDPPAGRVLPYCLQGLVLTGSKLGQALRKQCRRGRKALQPQHICLIPADILPLAAALCPYTSPPEELP